MADTNNKHSRQDALHGATKLRPSSSGEPFKKGLQGAATLKPQPLPPTPQPPKPNPNSGQKK